MKTRLWALTSLFAAGLFAQTGPLQELIEAAKSNSPGLKDLLAGGIPAVHGRDGAVVWGDEFLFAVESTTQAAVSIDRQPAFAMTNVAGTHQWYKLIRLRLGTTHNYEYFADGKSIGAYDVAGYGPDSYPEPDVPRGKLSGKKTLISKVYPGLSADYWVYVNAGADTTHGAPLMVWQDGQDIAGKQDAVRLRLQIVSDNLVHKKVIPPLVHVLIAPGSGGEAEGTRMRSIQYDTVSDRYAKYLLEEVLPEVEKTYKLRADPYSRAISGLSSGAIAALNVAWYRPDQFSRVLSFIGSYVGLQWHPERNLEGGYIVSNRVRREPKKNIRVWMSDGSNDQEVGAGSWPLNNLMLANALKLKGYDFHFRFGDGMHSAAQAALDLPETLAWLWRDYDPGKTEQTYEMEESERVKPLFRVKVANRDSW